MDNFIVLAALGAIILFSLWLSVSIVPQSQKYVVERLGRLHSVLIPGLNIIIPYVDRIAHKVSILERQLPRMRQDCITSDNVLLSAEIAVFFRVQRPEKTVYRIRDINAAVTTIVAGIVRSEVGKLELDAVQSSRATLNDELEQKLSVATDDWGISVTRAEVLEISLDEETRSAMLQQMNADRARRATIAQAEGDKRSTELKAEGNLYAEKQAAQALRVSADADAYATEVITKAIASGGLPAIEYDIRKRQVEALTSINQKPGSYVFFLPTELTGALGEAAKFFQATVQSKGREK